MARRTLTDRGVKALAPKTSRYHHPDPELKGHYVRVLPTGTKTFAAVAPDPRGKQVWATFSSRRMPSAIRSRRKGDGFFVALAPTHHGPSHSGDFVSKGDGSDLGRPPRQ